MTHADQTEVFMQRESVWNFSSLCKLEELRNTAQRSAGTERRIHLQRGGEREVHSSVNNEAVCSLE